MNLFIRYINPISCTITASTPIRYKNCMYFRTSSISFELKSVFTVTCMLAPLRCAYVTAFSISSDVKLCANARAPYL